jgi:hypothetical protein
MPAGAPPPPPLVGVHPSPLSASSASIGDYMGWAVLSLFLFLPTGVVALVKASNANSKKAVGDYAGAAADADNAKQWCWLSAIIGIVLIVALVAAAASNSSSSGGY